MIHLRRVSFIWPNISDLQLTWSLRYVNLSMVDQLHVISVDSCFDSSCLTEEPGGPEKGFQILSQHLMENLCIHKSLLSIFKKKQAFNKHITRNHNIISKKPHLNHLKIKSIEPPHYSPAQQQFFGPSA